MKTRGVRLSLPVALSLVFLLVLIVPVFAQPVPSVVDPTAPQAPLAPGDVHNYASAEVPIAIATNGVTYTSHITVTDTYFIGDVNVTLRITHTFDGDLDIYLSSPSGTRVELSTDNGSTGDNFAVTTFDDEAATAITAGTAPFNGSYRPEGLLSTLDGGNVNGVWTLEVFDDASGDTGTLTDWSLTIQEPAPNYSTSTKAVSPQVHVGQRTTYTVTLINTGLFTGTTTTLTDPVPVGATYVDSSAAVLGSGTLLADTAGIAWTGSIAPSQRVTVTYQVTLTVNSGLITNTATITDPLLTAAVVKTATTALQSPVGGPDLGGYTYADSYAVGGPAFTWVFTTPASTAYTTAGDDAFVQFPLGFNFRFYTGTYTQAFASTNGLVAFGAGSSAFSNVSIPTSSVPNNYASCFWDDQEIESGTSQGIWYETFGSAPNRYAIVTFVLQNRTTGAITPYEYQMLLFEGTGQILCQYRSMSGAAAGDGKSATVGPENASGTIGLQYSSDKNPGPIEDSLAILFSPPCEVPAGASFTYNPPAPLSGQSIDFTGAVLTGTAPLTYTWDFADGSPIGAGNPITHSYAVSGSYGVVMTVTNACGNTTYSQAVGVSDAPTPPTLGPLQSSSPTALGNPTYFTSTLLGGSVPITYTWDFGNGIVLVDGVTISHTYSGVGTYTTILTATNAAGEDVVTTTVDVGIAPTAAFAAINPTYYPATTVFTYTGNAGTPPTSFLWSFGDGVTSTLQNPSHAYAAPQPSNLYTATLSVSNGYGTAVTNTVVTVLNTSADLGIAKTDSPDPVAASQPLTYTLVVSNFGPNQLIGTPLTIVSFTNASYITIPSTGAATPYPSSINVSGITDVVGKVRVTLYGISHTFPNDIDVLLVGPSGQSVILMSDVGGTSAVSGSSVTFDDDAAAPVPASSLPSGTYRPTNSGTGDTFPSPAPVGSYGTALNSFAGSNPNGAWGLYVVDDAAGDSGAITGGWSLNFTTVTPVTTTVTDVLPAGYTFGGAAGSGWTCANNSGTVTCTRGAFPIGAAPNIVITGNAPTPAGSGGVTNTATVSSLLSDSNLLNNTAVITTFVNALRSDLSVAKTGTPSVAALDSMVTYWITVTNGGPDATSGVKFVDTLPAAFTFASASGSCATNASVVTCTLGTLNNGANASASIVVTATVYGTFTNTVTASSDNPDLVPGNNTATATTAIVWPEISVTPGDFSAVQAPNKLTTQTLTINNGGLVSLHWNLYESLPVLALSSEGTASASAPFDPATLARSQDKAEVTDATTPAEVLPTRQTVIIDPFSEGFDNVTTLSGKGWAQINRSNPLGGTNWYQGVGTVFPAHTGVISTSYVAANYNNTSGAGTISNWLLTPEVELSNGAVFTFYTRVPSPVNYPDRLEVRLSVNGASTDVGTTESSVGDFTTLLLTINPTLTVSGYPTTWTAYSVTVSGLANSTSGRLGFRYYVTDGGPSGDNSSYIGIDTFSYTPAPGPCSNPADLPWVSASPISGTISASGSSAVNVTFNSTGLTTGVYTGTLCLTSDDGDTPRVEIPVSLNVKLYSIYLPLIRK